MPPDLLRKAVADLPAGRWAVGVSGGADSVALLLLLNQRADLFLHVVHLDHETRAGQSTLDAELVRGLASELKLPVTIQKRSAVEMELPDLPANPSGRYRLARLALFRRLVHAERLAGVVLAHHADDQAETVLMRILNGSVASNLTGIRRQSTVSGVHIVRPLLEIPGQQLRDFLVQSGQPWREDASNQSDDYQRNRLRRWLAPRPAARDSLLKLAKASHAARQWLDSTAPVLAESFPTKNLCDLPAPLACHAASRWLIERGAPPRQVTGECCERLIAMCADAALPARQHFPGQLLIRRKGGMIFVEPD